MLLPLFNSFKFIGSTTTPSKFPTASFICRLNHSYIRQFFVLSCILSLSRQFFGDSIVCMTDGAKIPHDFIHYSCFNNGTYTVNKDNGEIYHHGYYQWVPLYLLFLAFAFYAPYQLFSHWLTRPVPVCHERADYDRIAACIFHPSCHRNAFFKTVMIECFYLAVVLPSLAVLTNAFLDFKLSSVPLERLFPLEGNCSLNYFNAGSETSATFRCLLPVNVVYRLVFEIVHWAFWIVVFLHVISLLYKAILYHFPVLRRTRVENVDVWWILRIVECNTQGEHLWRLRKAIQNYSITSKATEIPSEVTVSSL